MTCTCVTNSHLRFAGQESLTRCSPAFTRRQFEPCTSGIQFLVNLFVQRLTADSSSKPRVYLDSDLFSQRFFFIFNYYFFFTKLVYFGSHSFKNGQEMGKESWGSTRGYCKKTCLVDDCFRLHTSTFLKGFVITALTKKNRKYFPPYPLF